ncbi:MAG: DNA-processing protein DprA [Myxococcales bacterium]|nr:DNA-processing protein DprA [Myxococcales bacterium]
MQPPQSLDLAALGLLRRRPLDLSGDLPPPPRLAIVGARAAHRRFAALVPALVEAGARRGFSLVSGGALGIDAAAHRAALAAGVPQLAILPASFDEPYPPGNLGLFNAIAAAPGSGVAFALARDQAPSRGIFASRNDLVIGLASAVIVVEAGLRSGSGGSGRLALRRGRPLAALIGSPGCGALIAAGARPLRAEDPAALADEAAAWLADPTAAPAGDRWPAELADLSDALERAGDAGLAIDDLDVIEAPTALLVALSEAEARGLVVEIAPGRYRRSDHHGAGEKAPERDR